MTNEAYHSVLLACIDYKISENSCSELEFVEKLIPKYICGYIARFGKLNVSPPNKYIIRESSFSNQNI